MNSFMKNVGNFCINILFSELRLAQSHRSREQKAKDRKAVEMERERKHRISRSIN